jgi:CRP/FNR family cyclic AMP-dependent transcriptional regulator
MADTKFLNIHALWGYIFNKNEDDLKTDKISILQEIPVFKQLSRRELSRVADIIHERNYEVGEYMFHKDQPGAAMFIIKTGLVEIVMPDKEGKELTLAVLKKKTFVGELALLDDSPRSAGAKAVEPTEALAFFRTDLNKLLDSDPTIASKILKELALIIGKRLKLTNDQLHGNS